MAHALPVGNVCSRPLLDLSTVGHEPQDHGQCSFGGGKRNQYGGSEHGGDDKRFHERVIGAAFQKVQGSSS